MSYLFPNYARQSLDIIRGEGCFVYDQTGRKYLDLTSGIGVTSLGHQHPKITESVRCQLKEIWHTSNLYESQLQETVAKKLARGENYRTYFCNSGAEANEAAIKLARKATGRTQILTFDHSFHGRTYGALSATGQKKLQAGFGPLVPDFYSLPYNELAPLKQALNQETAAVLLEIIQGEGGVLPADKKWVQEVARLCRENGTLFMIDEVQTGIGRTGSFYAFEAYEVRPDIFTLAKALANGLPIGAMLGKEELSDAFSPGAHGTTFGGNKLALSAASAVIDEIDQPDFLTKVKENGDYLLCELTRLAEKSPHVRAVRGKGLMIGIQLDTSENLEKTLQNLKEQGVLALKAGNDVLRLLPPLVISKEELQQAVETLRSVLERFEKTPVI